MAIDKNSKAYQSLTNQGYTDDQITQMYNTASEKGTTQGVVPYNPMADLTPEYIANMDMNKQIRGANQSFSQYGDDSSRDKQDTRGGLNQKYTGEGVKTSDINYNPDITTKDLNPNFVYGKQSQVYGTDHPGYISQRNDDIASALYNEGLVSREDVERFLMAQGGFTNSSEEDRANTIESVWKRLGAIAQQNKQQEPERENPEMDVEGTPGGVIYGRASGDEGVKINTQADPNSPEAISLRGRINNYKSLQAMDSYNIALSLSAGNSLFGEQAMRDLSQFDPQKYQEIQTELRRIQQGDTVNAIASGENKITTSQVDNSTKVVNNSIDTWVSQNSTPRSSGQVQDIITNKLASSQVAQTATQEMLNLKKDMAELESELENLPKTVKSQFKGDVPQYIIDAKVANENQRIQAELNKLQSRYNGAIELYKTELAQKQREAEMELKEKQFSSDQNYRNREMNYNNKKLALSAQDQAWNQNYMNTKLKYDNIKEINGEAYVMDASTGKWTKLSDDMAYQSYMATVKDTLNTYLQSFPVGSSGGQCERFTDAFTYSVTGLKMEGANGGATTAKEKEGYVNTWIPEIGSVAVYDYGIKQADGINYGHTMLVTGWDPTTGIVTLTGSNRSSKEGEYEAVYQEQVTLAQLNQNKAFKGFWNPYLDKVEQSYGDGSQWNQYFPRVNTPMSTVIDNLKTNAGTAGERTLIAVGEQMYNTMYELESQGYLDALITSGVMQDFINGLDRKNFGKQGDERGSAFLEQLGKYLRNEIKDERVAYAMNRLYQLVEQKLREESGAAISSSEWAMDFQLFLPQPGQSEELRRKQLQAWDDIIYKQLSSTGMKSDQYVPIFDYSSNTTLGSGRETR